MAREALRNNSVQKRSKTQDSVGLIDCCRRTEREILDDMASSGGIWVSSAKPESHSNYIRILAFSW